MMSWLCVRRLPFPSLPPSGREYCPNICIQHTRTTGSLAGLSVSIPADELMGKYSCYSLRFKIPGHLSVPENRNTDTARRRFVSNPEEVLPSCQRCYKRQKQRAVPFWEAVNLVTTCFKIMQIDVTLLFLCRDRRRRRGRERNNKRRGFVFGIRLRVVGRVYRRLINVERYCLPDTHTHTHTRASICKQHHFIAPLQVLAAFSAFCSEL